MSGKTVTQAYTKWLNNNWPEANPIEMVMAHRAYVAGRNDLLKVQKRERDLKAQRMRLTRSE